MKQNQKVVQQMAQPNGQNRTEAQTKTNAALYGTRGGGKPLSRNPFSRQPKISLPA